MHIETGVICQGRNKGEQQNISAETCDCFETVHNRDIYDCSERGRRGCLFFQIHLQGRRIHRMSMENQKTEYTHTKDIGGSQNAQQKDKRKFFFQADDIQVIDDESGAGIVGEAKKVMCLPP